MVVYTDWQPIATDAKYYNTTTQTTEHTWPWIQYADDEIAIDIGDALAEGEAIEGLVTHLWLLKSTSEASNTNEDDLLEGAPTTSGTIVKQRMNGLVFERIYRLFIGFGPAGNHRYVTAVIEVVG